MSHSSHERSSGVSMPVRCAVTSQLREARHVVAEERLAREGEDLAVDGEAHRLLGAERAAVRVLAMLRDLVERRERRLHRVRAAEVVQRDGGRPRLEGPDGGVEGVEEHGVRDAIEETREVGRRLVAGLARGRRRVAGAVIALERHAGERHVRPVVRIDVEDLDMPLGEVDQRPVDPRAGRGRDGEDGSRLMELCFAEVESTFDYFRATRRYLERHGKPMAFYSDRLSVFHVQARDGAQGGAGLSQFGRACRALNIDLLCARSPEAKGRVERANGTLQDRLVKELRLRGLNDPAAATRFLPAFMPDYNRRFAKPPAVAYDAHRPLRPEDDLSQLFNLQDDAPDQPPAHRALQAGPLRARRHRCDPPPARGHRGDPGGRGRHHHLACPGSPARGPTLPEGSRAARPGAVVEYPHLDGVFTWIAARQCERDAARLTNPKVSGREKQRLRAGTPLRAPAPRTE